MADDTNTTLSNMQDFAAVLGDAVAAGLAKHSPKRVPYGEYVRRTTKGRPRLRRETFDNGRPIDVGVLSPNEINLLNQITRSGRYINRLVEVIVREEGADEIVEIRYNNKTADQRFEMKGFVKSFEDMLQQIVTAQTLETAEAHEKSERQTARRAFGDTKAFREAKAQAEG